MCTKDCGQLEPPDERELIDAFEIAMNDAFAFLGPEHQLEPAPVGVYGLSDSGRSPADRADVSYPFLAVQEFTGANPPVRITYGARDYHLELEVGVNGSGYHSIRSWLTALDVAGGPQEDLGVSTPTSLARHARRLAKTLRDHFEAIRGAGPEVIARLGDSATPLHQTRRTANAAFADGDYATYIELLTPYADALTVTERRKLEFANQKVA